MTRRSLIASSTLLASSLSLAQIPADITLEPAFGGATFNRPVAIRHADDGSGRRFIVQLDGFVRIVDASDNVLATPFLDISSLTNAGGERGLLGLAFHPDYANNGRIYVNYTDAESENGIDTGHTVIAEFQVSGDNPDVIDFDSRNTILVIPQDFANHNGGDIHFGPDGYLYIGMGDGGDADDPCERSQTLDPSTPPADPPSGEECLPGEAAWLLGKMLRIDIDNTTPAGNNNLCAANPDGSAEYAVPADNPFVGETDRCGEVWAYGLRNPFRFSFDRENGDLWIGDVGQNRWEEISYLSAGSPAGANFGWKTCEASFQRGSLSVSCPLAESILPILEYGRSSGCSVTGGYRYRGPVNSLQGFYVYSDYCSGRIWFASESSPGQWANELFNVFAPGGFGNHGGYGEDEEGNLYLIRLTGDIYQFSGEVIPPELVFSDRFEQEN